MNRYKTEIPFTFSSVTKEFIKPNYNNKRLKAIQHCRRNKRNVGVISSWRASSILKSASFVHERGLKRLDCVIHQIGVHTHTHWVKEWSFWLDFRFQYNLKEGIQALVPRIKSELDFIQTWADILAIYICRGGFTTGHLPRTARKNMSIFRFTKKLFAAF